MATKRPPEQGTTPAAAPLAKLPRLDPQPGVPGAVAAAGVAKPAAPRLPMLMYKDGEPLRDLRSYYSKEGGGQSVEVRRE